MVVVAEQKHAPDRIYFETIKEFLPRPIQDDKAHRKAKAVLRKLAGKKSRVAADYKEVLLLLIERYERQAGHHLDTSGVTAADVVRNALDNRGMTITDLANHLAIPKSTLSEMLRGRRAWSKSVIVKLSDFFALDPMLFLR